MLEHGIEFPNDGTRHKSRNTDPFEIPMNECFTHPERRKKVSESSHKIQDNQNTKRSKTKKIEKMKSTASILCAGAGSILLATVANLANAELVKMCLYYKAAGHARTDPILVSTIINKQTDSSRRIARFFTGL